MSVMHSAVRTIRSGSPTDTQTVSKTPHSRGISVLFRSRTTSYQPPFTPESIENSTRLDGSDTFNCSALAGTLLMCATNCVNVSIPSFRWILGLICNRNFFSNEKKSRVLICRTPGTMPESGEDRLFRSFIPADRRNLYTVVIRQIAVTAFTVTARDMKCSASTGSHTCCAA